VSAAAGGAARPRRPIRAVVFDVGETLIDESTEYHAWADWLGVPRHTFSAMFGAVIARGEDYRQVFQVFRPGFDLSTERQKRAEAGVPEHFDARDLYPDARPCLVALKEAGYVVGIAGNQTSRAGRLLHELNLPVDWICTSDDWGAEKPSPEFFKAVIAQCDLPPEQIAYVGDRLDNDIQPALAAGLVAVFIHRGPWGHQVEDQVALDGVPIQLTSLEDLPARLEGFSPENR